MVCCSFPLVVASLNSIVGSAGANLVGDKSSPQVTSYDYDAPLSEAGDPRPKLTAIRNVIRQVSAKTANFFTVY